MRRTALLLLIAGCGSPVEVRLPASDHRSVIVAVDRGSTRSLEVQAYDGAGENFSLAISEEEEVRITALLYDVPLAALGLSSGRIEEAGPNEQGLPLPAEDSIRENVVSEGKETGWATRTERSGRVADFRMRAVGPAECAELGGCRTEDLACEVPCDSPPSPAPPLEPAAPAAAAPPDQRPCPAGWSEESLQGGFLCVPPATVGTPCDAASEYANDLPVDRTIYYAAPGGTGDGTPSSPFGTVAEALAAAAPGDVVALSKGEFREEIEVPAGATIHGACPEQTVIVSSSTETPALVVSGDAEIRNLRVHGTVRSASGRTELSDLVIDTGDVGWRVEEGAAGVGARLVVEDVNRYGIDAAGAPVTLENVLVRRVQPRADGASGIGLHASSGDLRVVRSIVEDNYTFGIFGTNGSTITIDSTVIRRTAPRQRGLDDGGGIAVVEGSSLEATGVLIAESHDRGLWIQHAGTRAVVRDLIVLDTLPEEKQNDSGRGIDVRKEARADLGRVVVERCTSYGLEATEGARLFASDLIIRDVGPTPSDGLRGQGLRVSSGAVATVSRAEIDDSHTSGVSVWNAGGLVDMEDLRIVGIQQSPGESSFNNFGGIWIGGAEVVIDRASVSGAEAVGVRVVGDAIAEIGDLMVIGGERAGVRVSDAAIATFSRLVVAGVDGDNVQIDEDGRAMLFDARLSGSMSRSIRAGSGLTTSGASHATVTRFQLDANDAFGVRIELTSVLELSQGEIAGSQIGALVGRSDYDLSLLTRDVRYRDNQQAINRP